MMKMRIADCGCTMCNERGTWTYDLMSLLDAHRPGSITAYLETSTNKNDNEVIRLVLDDGLQELDDHGNRVENRAGDGKWKIGIIEPNGIWVRLRHCDAFFLWFDELGYR